MEKYYVLYKKNKIIAKLFLIMMFMCFIQNNAYALIINKVNPVYSFVNNEKELEELRTKLIQGNRVGITGITGKGKSELAKKYVEKYAKNYELIAFIDVDSDLIPQYIEIGKALNKDRSNNISLDPNKIKQNLKKYLDSQSNW
jgi:ATPase subunit of ABC transporter with duplicated ATPase domains